MKETSDREVLMAAGPGRQPLYAALAALLVRDIEDGKYPPSSTLPSEKELTERYGLSRQTVRQALRSVRDQGLISSHAGVGTIVRGPVSRQIRFNSVNSIEDLLHFVGTTEMHALSLREVTVDAALARKLECKPGLLLSEVSFLRKTPGSDLPISHLVLYVHPRFAAAQKTPSVTSTPIYKNIERLFGVRVHEVRQDISATVLDTTLAKSLQAKPGDAALEIKRFYYDANNTLVQTSISWYPADRYTQSARFRASSDMT